jgi:hypothetical protein
MVTYMNEITGQKLSTTKIETNVWGKKAAVRHDPSNRWYCIDIR